MRKFLIGEINPIIVKEIRSRMRGIRAFAILTGMLILLGGFSYLLYRMVLSASRYLTSPVSPLIGQTLFAGLAFLELIIICAVVPSVTASAISGEKEKLTYEMLLVTPLHPVNILWGKLIASLGYVFLLVFAAIPMASLIFIFGGVILRDMLKALTFLGVVAVMFGVIGIFMSSIFGKSGRATAFTYLVVLLMMFAPMFLAMGVSVIRQTEPPRWILIPSPISSLASALSPSVNIQNIMGLFQFYGSFSWIFGPPPISMDQIPRPLYHYSLPIYGAITLVLLLLSTRLVLPTNKWRIRWGEVLILLVLFIGFMGVVTLAYAATTGRYENIQISRPTPTPFMEVPPPSELVPPPPTEVLPPPEEIPSPETPPEESTPLPGQSPKGYFPYLGVT